MQNDNIYLYAVLPRNHDGAYIPHGVQGLPVYLCSQGSLSAAISFLPAFTHLQDGRAHRRVMQQLLKHIAVLPAPIPTILPNQGTLQELLSQQQQPMLAQLRRFAGLVEVRLHVKARQAIPAASALDAERADLLAHFSTALQSGGFCVRARPLRHAQDLLRLACLLPRTSLELFGFTCKAFSARLTPGYELSVSQPMAAFDFTSPDLFSRLEQKSTVAASAGFAANPSSPCESVRNPSTSLQSLPSFVSLRLNPWFGTSLAT